MSTENPSYQFTYHVARNISGLSILSQLSLTYIIGVCKMQTEFIYAKLVLQVVSIPSVLTTEIVTTIQSALLE